MAAVASELGMATSLGWILEGSTEQMNAEFEDYSNLGVKWLRVDFWWDIAQKTKDGAYNWAQMDKVVAAAESHGIKIIAELNSIAGKQSWVDGTYASATSRADFAKFAAAAAAHFGNKVDYWEILNEPNMKHITASNYTELLKSAYTAIKSVDSGDTVITGGLAAAPTTANGIYGAVDYLKEMYASGAKGFFDAVGYHPYSWPLMPDSPRAWNGWEIMESGIRGTMTSNGDAAKQVWMTEFGAPTAGSVNAVTHEKQAEILAQAVELAHTYSWAGPMLWFTYEDGESPTTIANWYGLIDGNGTRKEVYYTYKSLAHGLENLVGSTASEVISGDNANNVLQGLSGDDVLVGNGGNDTIWGGSGNDTFVFKDTAIGWDTIKDFESGDKIDLSAIDANTKVAGDQAFQFIGTNWLSGVRDLGYYADAAGHTSIQGDVDGDHKYDFSIRVDGHHAFTADDFIL